MKDRSDDKMKYRVGDREITCPCCGHNTFDMDYRQLNTSTATFFNLDWANKNATILICHYCTHIAWFMEEPDEV